MAYVDVAELQRVIAKPTMTAAETAAANRVIDTGAREIDWDLAFGPDNPAPLVGTPEYELLADVNLTRAEELWKFNYSTTGVLPVGPEVGPIIAPRDTWYRHHLRLNPLRTSWGIG